ncbi:hypothetical protein TIFTF001_031434 [Ficus carica]|uniref:Uncharacterized protein n=1 Tax=Ficus carica TaxID=3494 RepID=A0AA88E1C4_FICCA|nr:hypothetical protein TIFTF001_031434 [Ficus carica]
MQYTLPSALSLSTSSSPASAAICHHFLTSLHPDPSVTDHFRICSDISFAIRILSCLPYISFTRFLVEGLLESLLGGKSGGFSVRSKVNRDEFKTCLEDGVEKTDENGVDNNSK